MRGSHLPLFGLRKNQVTTNEQIFRILSHQYPQTVASLREGLFKEFRERLSYQAVRKAVIALCELGTLEHGKHGYQISTDWLLRTRAVIDETLQRYRIGRGRALGKAGTHQVFTGDSLYDIDTFWGDVVVNLCRRNSKCARPRFISINHYPWWIPINVGHESKFCADLMRLGYEVIFIFLSRGSAADWARKFYKTVLARTCPSIPQTHYYNVIGNSVIEVVLNQELTQSIHRLFGNERTPGSIPPQALVKLTKQKGEIRLSVQESSAFAMGLLQAMALN